MVSARANVEPMQIERRTAAAAPVTAFTPTIPGNPIMPLSGSSALEPCLASLESHYPVTPYARRKGDGTPRRPNPTETLDVGHPGHTFDLEWYLGGGRRLENERGQPLKSGQNRSRGIEKRPIPEIAVRTGHQRRPLRLGHGKNADQPAAFPELLVEPIGGDLGRTVD